MYVGGWVMDRKLNFGTLNDNISITIISHVFQKSPASREPLQLHPAPPPTSVSQSHDGHVGAPANQHRNRSCGVAAAGVQQEKQTLPEQVSPMSDSSTD